MNNLSITWQLVICFFVSALTVLAVTPLVRRMLTAMGMVDKPDARRINKKPIARGGGVAVMLGLVTGTLVWLYLFDGINTHYADTMNKVGLSIALAVVFAVAFLDDKFNLKPILKLAGQVVAATIVFRSGVSFANISWFEPPWYMDYAMTLGWFVIIINAFNLIDGMDGLASGLAMISCFGLSACLISRGQISEIFPLIILSGACLGFLRYNFNPASIFLGDCGSQLIGMVIAIVPLRSGGKGAFLASVGVPLLIMGVPLFDSLLAIWRRSVRAVLSNDRTKKGVMCVMQADMDHLHHRFLAMGFSQRKVAMVLYGISAVMVSVAVAASTFSQFTTGIVMLGALALIAILARVLTRVELWDTGRMILNSSHGAMLPRLSAPLYFIGDILSIIAAWFIASGLSCVATYPTYRLFTVLPIFMLCIAVMLAYADTYRRVWAHANSRDYAILVAATFAGWCIGYSLVTILRLRYGGFYRQALVFLPVCTMLIMALRIFRVLISAALASVENSRLRSSPNAVRSLVYGAGEHFRIFILMSQGSILGHSRRAILAAIDDEPALRGRVIQGCQVVGGIDRLEEAIVRYNPNEIFITSTKITGEHLERTMEMAEKYHLTVSTFGFSTKCLREGIAPVVAEETENGKV